MRQLPDKPDCLNRSNLLYCLKILVHNNSQTAFTLPCRGVGAKPERSASTAGRGRAAALQPPWNKTEQGGSHAKFHLERIFQAGFIKYLGTRGFVVKMPGNPPVNYSRSSPPVKSCPGPPLERMRHAAGSVC